MPKILVTGGCGYIGSHTLVDLTEHGYDVISVDNNKRSNPIVLDGIEKITRKRIKNYKVDLCNYDDTFAIFQENRKHRRHRHSEGSNLIILDPFSRYFFNTV